MLKRLFSLLAGKRLHRLVLLAGLLLVGTALYQLAQTAIFVHESAVVPGEVLDVRQSPFESATAALLSGNWAAAGTPAYRPIVCFVLPGNGARVSRLMAEEDAEDYAEGSTVEVRTRPLDPSTARVNKARLLWAADAGRLALGILLVLLARLLRGRKKGKAAPKTAPRQAPRPVESVPAPEKKPRRRTRKGEQMELSLDMPASEKKPSKKRGLRRKKSA